VHSKGGRMQRLPAKIQMRSESYKWRCLGRHPPLCVRHGVDAEQRSSYRREVFPEAAVWSSLVVVEFPIELENSQNNSWVRWRISNGLKKNFSNSSVKWGIWRAFLAWCESCCSPFLYKWLNNMYHCAGKLKLLLLVSVTLSQIRKISELQPHFMLCYIIYVHIQETNLLIYRPCRYFKINWLCFKNSYSDMLYPIFDRKQLLWFVAWMENIWGCCRKWSCASNPSMMTGSVFV